MPLEYSIYEFPVIHVSLLSDEVDEIEVYGSEAQSGTQLATYSFEVK